MLSYIRCYSYICIMIALFISVLIPGTTTLAADPIVRIHITDFGINQWDVNLETGQNFAIIKSNGTSVNYVYPEIDQLGQILIVMPTREIIESIGWDRLKSHFETTILKSIDIALEKGVTEFEIQLVQNIDKTGYFDKIAQQHATAFAASAYKAIGSANERLKIQCSVQTSIDATVGSNGGAKLAENTQHWRNYLQAVDFYDARASMDDVINTIDVIKEMQGTNSVRLFNTRGDWPGADKNMSRGIEAILFAASSSFTDTGTRMWGEYIIACTGGAPFISVANLDVAAQVKELRPDTQAYLLRRVDRPEKTPKFDRFGASHIAGMNGKQYREALFMIREVLKTNDSGSTILSLPRPTTFETLRNSSSNITVELSPDASSPLKNPSSYHSRAGGSPIALVIAGFPPARE